MQDCYLRQHFISRLGIRIDPDQSNIGLATIRRRSTLALTPRPSGQHGRQDRQDSHQDRFQAPLARPIEQMVDAVYEAVRFHERRAVNSCRDFKKGVRAMIVAAMND